MSYIERHISRLPGEPNEEALPGEPQVVTTDTHDNMERHNFETLWGQPPTPAGPGIASPGFSPIPARADHVHPGGTGGISTIFRSFNRPGLIAVAASDHNVIGYEETTPHVAHQLLAWAVDVVTAPSTSSIVIAALRDGTSIATITVPVGTRKVYQAVPQTPGIKGTSWGAPATTEANWTEWDAAITNAGSGNAVGVVIFMWFKAADP